MANLVDQGSSVAASGPKGTDFHGAKLAVFVGSRLLTLLRDDKSSIPFPAHWDMIGGGREGHESPVECVLRECLEETGVALPPEALVWGRPYVIDVGVVWFFVAQLREQGAPTFSLQDEGQELRLVAADTYLTMPRAISRFQARLADFIAGVPDGRGL